MSWTMFGAVMTIIVVCIVVLVVVIKDLSANKTVKPNTNYTEKEEYTSQETAKFAKNIKIFAIILALVVLFFIIKAISGKVIENRIVEYFTEDSEAYVVLVQKATAHKVDSRPLANFYFVTVRTDWSCSNYLVVYEKGKIYASKQ